MSKVSFGPGITGQDGVYVAESSFIVGMKYTAWSCLRPHGLASIICSTRSLRTTESEMTPLHPRSPYAAAEAYAHDVTTAYPDACGLFACSGILFNDESLGGENFVCSQSVTELVETALSMVGLTGLSTSRSSPPTCSLPTCLTSLLTLGNRVKGSRRAQKLPFEEMICQMLDHDLTAPGLIPTRFLGDQPLNHRTSAYQAEIKPFT